MDNHGVRNTREMAIDRTWAKGQIHLFKQREGMPRTFRTMPIITNEEFDDDILVRGSRRKSRLLPLGMGWICQASHVAVA
jgi:hypothetical protein